jgi:hypothetical protein
LCELTLLTVVHPHLGIGWFRKLDSDRANEALAILDYAYQEYNVKFGPKLVTPPATAPKRTASSNSFLDALCMVDVEVKDNFVPTAVMGELERFLALDKSFGLGDRDYPLLWWKVQHFSFHPSLGLD